MRNYDIAIATYLIIGNNYLADGKPINIITGMLFIGIAAAVLFTRKD